MKHDVTVHSVCCNTRDCPWYRRGSKCKNPYAQNINVAKHNMDGVPDLCPLHKESHVLMANHDVSGKNVILERTESAIKGLGFWLNIMKKHGPKQPGSKKGDSHVRRQVHSN